jgi:putative nucleotidyltransferase with HDIG domain
MERWYSPRYGEEGCGGMNMTVNDSYLRETFPQITQIKDTRIQKGVIETFCQVAKKGGWDTLEGIPFTLLTDTDISLVDHINAVTDMAIQVATVMQRFVEINMDHLIAGGLLHDVGKLLEYEKREGTIQKCRYGELLRHPVSGVIIAAQAGLPPEVLHLIIAHSKEGDAIKRTHEAIILHHCDFIHFETVKT